MTARPIWLAVAVAACNPALPEPVKPDAVVDTGSVASTTTTTPPTADPGGLTLCKPPRVELDLPIAYTVGGLAPGETAVLYYGDHGEARETCFEEYADLCTRLARPQVLGQAIADADGTATLVRSLSGAAHASGLLAVQAFVDRGPESASSNPTLSPVLGEGAPTRSCDDADTCPDLADSDGDGVSDVCDRCPGADDRADRDLDGVPDVCDPLSLDPEALVLEADAEEATSAAVTVLSALDRDAGYSVRPACDWLSVDTGEALPDAGRVPAHGVAQFRVDASAVGLVPGTYRCDLVVGVERADRDVLPLSLPVTLTVTEPGLDLTFPPGDASTPTGILAGLQVTVTDEAGVGQPDFRVEYGIIQRATGVVFVESGTRDYDTVTDASGVAIANLLPPEGFAGLVDVTIDVWYPLGDQLVASFEVQRTWTVPQGNIYFWELDGGGGNIMTMPADFSSPPTVFDGTAHDGNCSGCHTASPGVLPTTGRGAVFTQDRGVMIEQILDMVTGEVVAEFPGDSADNDWSPDSSRVVWSDRDVRMYNVITGTNDAVSGADSAEYMEIFPTFSSDGSHIAYTRCRGCGGDALAASGGGVMSLWSVPSSGGVPVELVPEEADVAIYYPEFSPDGRWLAYNKSRTDQGGGPTPNTYSSSSAELWLVPVDPAGSRTTGPARRLDVANGLPGIANSWPTWAPDSTFIAFASNRSGDWDVFLSAISGAGADSPAVALPHASGPGGQHIPAWAP
ncbi:MAG: hypothetical protein ACI8PZ_006525 [Myxococcota bacterium]|jgi:hypothetical protein